MWKRIVLTGFSGTGKSTVAQLVAERLGWSTVDLDADLEDHFGATIPVVFENQGEQVFREAERHALLAALGQSNVVVATGGGAAVANEVWSSELLGHPETLTVSLDASPATMLTRLQAQVAAEGQHTERPMIAGHDPLESIARLKSQRSEAYDRSRVTIVVDNASPNEIASEIEAFLTSDAGPSVRLKTPTVTSQIYVRPGSLADSGTLLLERWPLARKAWIITDTNVGQHHAPALETSLQNQGIPNAILTVPPGESSKRLNRVSALFDQMLGSGVERGDVVIALGGGVVGDLAGFVAATVLRGIGLVQIPTSLLAMVDSSVGGKTGINHDTGKNLIGAFYQPPLVIIDPDVLHTLPKRELRQGWAEIIKHSIIQSSTPDGERNDLMSFLERNTGALLRLDESALSYLIRRNVELKSRVVEADERESGIRAFLNFGHTLGHAVEASNYDLLHGEAVAVGMHGAAIISTHVTGTDAQQTSRLLELLSRYRLPVVASTSPDRVRELISSDKKRTNNTQTWVLMLPEGGVELNTTVKPENIDTALERIIE